MSHAKWPSAQLELTAAVKPHGGHGAMLLHAYHGGQGISRRGIEASLFAFQNDSHVRDPHWLRIDPCMNSRENLRGKLAILLLRANVPASVMSHDILGKRSLIWDPTWVKGYKSTSRLQGMISEPNAIQGFFVGQVV